MIRGALWLSIMLVLSVGVSADDLSTSTYQGRLVDNEQNTRISLTERTGQIIRGNYLGSPVRFVSFKRDNGGVIVSLGLRQKSITAQYTGGGIADIQIEELSISATDPVLKKLTQEDHDLLLVLYLELESILSNNIEVEAKLLITIDFLVNFLPVGAEFDRITWPRERGRKRETEQIYKEICDERGNLYPYIYTDFFQIVDGEETVGDPASSCKGRCGRGCFQTTQREKRQYTEECFNHDFCTEEFPSFLGFEAPCNDEFRAAVDGYFNAPSCEHDPIGTWRLGIDWSCLGIFDVIRLVVFEDNKLIWGSSPELGTWSIDVDSIAGMREEIDYEGVIHKSDQIMQGTMTDDTGKAGCWIAVRDTTEVSTIMGDSM